MAKQDLTPNAQVSLLDRLIDTERRQITEPQLTRAQSLRLLRTSVRRDLEWLLNTHANILPVPDAYQELKKSLFVYGLPDVNSIKLGTAQDEARLVRTIENTIRTFEPRLAHVRVTPREQFTGRAHALHFQIEALLMVDPAPEHIAFDTVLEVTRGAYEVKES